MKKLWSKYEFRPYFGIPTRTDGKTEGRAHEHRCARHEGTFRCENNYCEVTERLSVCLCPSCWVVVSNLPPSMVSDGKEEAER